jgi:tetratricopeptide (TPR) repeat protein
MAEKITIQGFLNKFKWRHETMPDRPFCWILGSGASLQSGVPTGKDLVLQWLDELHTAEDFENRPIEEWVTAKNLKIKDFNFSRAASFYPLMYRRRFKDEEEGYAFLEKTMEHAEPSFGYSVLAQIMATTPHKVAITTNFDNLIADALSIYMRTFPLVCGHELLTAFIRPNNLRRPLIAKIHRDLLLDPLNEPHEIAKLRKGWPVALTKIFKRFTPVVIGYGGNDGSLMGYLKRLEPIEGGLFWCFREGDEVDPAIQKVVKHHRGDLVPIAGFDEVMLLLQVTLQHLPPLLQLLQNIQDKRVVNYRKQFVALIAEFTKPAVSEATVKSREPVRKAAETAVQRMTTEKSWWAWDLRANAEDDAAKAEAIYRNGLEEFPASVQLTLDFALFMERVRQNYDEAERLYKNALELDPNNVVATANFAYFMERVCKNYDKAEELYRKALKLDPSDPVATVNFPLFMQDVRKDYDEAERLYKKSLELDPNNVYLTANFASFMQHVRKDYDEAEQLYKKALELDPSNADVTASFALFMHDVRKNYDEAERLYKKALELDPNKVGFAANLASLMRDLPTPPPTVKLTPSGTRTATSTPRPARTPADL